MEISAIHLCRTSQGLEVRAEIEKHWHTIIVETDDDAPISHIVEEAGIRKAPLSE